MVICVLVAFPLQLIVKRVVFRKVLTDLIHFHPLGYFWGVLKVSDNSFLIC